MRFSENQIIISSRFSDKSKLSLSPRVEVNDSLGFPPASLDGAMHSRVVVVTCCFACKLQHRLSHDIEERLRKVTSGSLQQVGGDAAEGVGAAEVTVRVPL